MTHAPSHRWHANVESFLWPRLWGQQCRGDRKDKASAAWGGPSAAMWRESTLAGGFATWTPHLDCFIDDSSHARYLPGCLQRGVSRSKEV